MVINDRWHTPPKKPTDWFLFDAFRRARARRLNLNKAPQSAVEFVSRHTPFEAILPAIEDTWHCF